jgi:hypothetical protein
MPSGAFSIVMLEVLIPNVIMSYVIMMGVVVPFLCIFGRVKNIKVYFLNFATDF